MKRFWIITCITALLLTSLPVHATELPADSAPAITETDETDTDETETDEPFSDEASPLPEPEPEELTASLVLTLGASQITAGKTTTVTPQISSNYEDFNISYTYSSDKKDVATVDKNGKIAGVWKGSAIITVKATVTSGEMKTEVSERVTVKVINPAIKAATDKTSFNLIIGKSATIKPSVNAPLKIKSSTYTSSNKAVAAVDQKGKVTAKKAGTSKISVKITATDGQTQTKTVTVKVPSPSIQVNHVSPVILKENSIQLVPSLKDSGSSISSKTFSSSNKKVATVTSGGTVKGIKAGTATITINVKTKDKQTLKKKVTVTVKNSVTSKTAHITASGATILKGNKYMVKPTLKNSRSSISSSTFRTSDKKIATVTAAGTVIGKKQGKTTITVTSKTKDKQTLVKKVTITVKNSTTSKTPCITVSGSTSVNTGKSITLKPKLKNSSSSIKSTTFSSSNSKIAKVDSKGNVTGMKNGSAVITVTSKTKNNHTLIKKITVNVKTTLAYRVANSKTARKTNQIITVANGKLTLWEKNGSSWKSVLSASCKVGRNGISTNTKEGDYKTPAGAFTISLAFGRGNNPGTKLNYRKITNKSYWISNPADKHYNTWQERNSSSWLDEHLIDYSVYKYAMNIDSNPKCTPGKGSAIFLHCSTNSSTAGCVAVPESTMLQLMKRVDKSAYIIIAESEAKISNY